MDVVSLTVAVVVAVVSYGIGRVRGFVLGRVFIWCTVALFGAGLLGYVFGAGAPRLSGSEGIGLLMAGLGLLMVGCGAAVFSLPQAGFRMIFRQEKDDERRQQDPQ